MRSNGAVWNSAGELRVQAYLRHHAGSPGGCRAPGRPGGAPTIRVRPVFDAGADRVATAARPSTETQGGAGGCRPARRAPVLRAGASAARRWRLPPRSAHPARAMPSSRRLDADSMVIGRLIELACDMLLPIHRHSANTGFFGVGSTAWRVRALRTPANVRCGWASSPVRASACTRCAYRLRSSKPQPVAKRCACCREHHGWVIEVDGDQGIT